MFLSIVIAFCDKDWQCVEPILNLIEEKVSVSHEVILIDNRQDNHSPINFKNAEVHSKGYNAYQFEARRYAVQFCKGEYIWFVNVDDQILKIKPDLENAFTEDVICFNYMVFRQLIALPFTWKYTKEAFKRKRFTSIKKSELMDYCPTDDLWDICCCTLWNKWIRRDLMEKVIAPLESDQIIVASEDVLYCSLCIDRADTMCFCDDTIYIYHEGSAMANDRLMNNEKFNHIIKGYDKSRALFEKFISNWQDYNDIQTNAAYFLTKIRFCEDKTACLKTMQKYFSNEEILDALNHQWLINLEDKIEYEELKALCEKHL